MSDEIALSQSALEGLSAELQNFSQITEEIAENFSKLSKEGQSFSKSFSNELNGAMRSILVDGKSLNATLKNMALSMADKSFNAAIAPINSMIAQGVASVLPFAHGGVLQAGMVRKFADGGVVGAPTLFPMSSGLGLMGEAGAEAIMPLARGADGKLGVRTGADAPKAVHVNINISTPNAESFQKSKQQIASQIKRAIDSARG